MIPVYYCRLDDVQRLVAVDTVTERGHACRIWQEAGSTCVYVLGTVTRAVRTDAGIRDEVRTKLVEYHPVTVSVGDRLRTLQGEVYEVRAVEPYRMHAELEAVAVDD